MFLLGHLGIGSKLVSPLTRGLSYRLVLAGAVAPDLLDKTLYYVASWSTGKRGLELGLLSGSRTFGHTALAAFVIAGFAVARKSKIAAAFALGITSHLVLDQVTDVFIGNDPGHGLTALLWPFMGWQFPVMPYKDFSEQIGAGARPFILITEALGALVLAWDYWKARHRREILAQAQSSKAAERFFQSED